LAAQYLRPSCRQRTLLTELRSAPQSQLNYITLALGSAVALFLYLHTLATGWRASVSSRAPR
jgi:hypothetical protein